MSAHPTVTVAICTRNRPDLLESCLASLAGLDPPADEILVSDQSDPELAGQVRSVCRPPARYLQVGRRGIGYSRRAAAGATRTEVVAFTDDDCLVHPGWVGALRAAFADHPEAAAVTGATRPDPGKPLPPDLPSWVGDWGYPELRVFREPTEPGEVGGCLNSAFRIEALQAVDGFDPLFGSGEVTLTGEDMDIFHRLLRSGRSVVYTPDAVVSHHPPRDLREHQRNERNYARGYGAWAGKGAAQGDPLPPRCWRRVFRRNLIYLVRRGPWEGPGRMWQRARVAWELLAGRSGSARAYRRSEVS